MISDDPDCHLSPQLQPQLTVEQVDRKDETTDCNNISTSNELEYRVSNDQPTVEDQATSKQTQRQQRVEDEEKQTSSCRISSTQYYTHQPNDTHFQSRKIRVKTYQNQDQELETYQKTDNNHKSSDMTTATTKLNQSSNPNMGSPHCLSITVGDYIVLKPVKCTTLYQCINRVTRKVNLCKIIETRNYHAYLAIYERLKNGSGIAQIVDIAIGRLYTVLIIGDAYGDMHSYVIKKHHLTENESRKLFHQICSIVAHCHAEGVVLRDIKLSKFIFIDQAKTQLALESWDDAVLLADPSDDTIVGKYGCPHYAAPELLQKQTHHYSGRYSDCWSLGVLLFTMLVGGYPFHDADRSKLVVRIRRDALVVPESISPSAEFLLFNLICREPKNRLSAQAALDDRWFKEKDPCFEPDQFLPPNRFVEMDDIQPFIHRFPPISSVSSVNSSSHQPSLNNTPAASVAGVTPNRHFLSSTSYHPYLFARANEHRPRRKLNTANQIVPEYTSFMYFQGSLNSGF